MIPTPSQHRRNNLDLLRLVFASLVVLAHAPELIDGNRGRELLSVLTRQAISFGDFAVDGFFALSGYLIVASWSRKPRWVPYLRNRILRIYPGYIVAVFISVLIVGPLGMNPEAYFRQFGIGDFFFGIVALRSPAYVESFIGHPYPFVNAALWTISYEFTLYLAVLAIGLLARRRFRSIWLVSTVLLLVGSFFLPDMHRLPLRLVETIRLGSIFFAGGALYLTGFEGFKSALPIALVAACLVASLFSVRFDTPGFAIFGSLLFLSLGLRRQIFRFTAHWPDISYGTYLYGWPILKLVTWYLPDLGPAAVFGLSLPLSLICGYLSWVCVESRFMRLKTERTLPTGQRV